jgi:hypothetical protein
VPAARARRLADAASLPLETALSSLLARQRAAKDDPPRAEALDATLDRHRARPWSEVLFHGPNKKWAVKSADQIGAPSVARLRLRLLRADGLEAGDASGTSDPYCEVRVWCRESPACEHMWRSATKLKTLEPAWDEQAEMALSHRGALLHCLVFDWRPARVEHAISWARAQPADQEIDTSPPAGTTSAPTTSSARRSSTCASTRTSGRTRSSSTSPTCAAPSSGAARCTSRCRSRQRAASRRRATPHAPRGVPGVPTCEARRPERYNTSVVRRAGFKFL